MNLSSDIKFIKWIISEDPQEYLNLRNDFIDLRTALVNAELRCQRLEEEKRKVINDR